MADTPKISKLACVLAAIVLCVLAIPLVWLAVKTLEGEAPTFALEKPTRHIGASHTLSAMVSDRKSGLRRIWIAILQQGRQVLVLDKTFPSKGFLRGGAVRKHRVSLEIRAQDLGLKDGEAVLRIAVWDYSCRGWWDGNRSYAEHKMAIDTRPPPIEVLTRSHNLNQGGAGLAVYRVSESVSSTGVEVADRFFAGSNGYFGRPDIFVAFFAIPYDNGPETQLYVTATDMADNTSRKGLPCYINPKQFKKDSVNITDAFLERKIPEFDPGVFRNLGTANGSGSLVEKFLAANKELRRANRKTIEDTCKNSDTEIHWAGPFLRLSGSARKAGFADHRTYKYQGRTIDKQVHLGIDLASTAHSEVLAANSGRVVLSQDLGIYGNTVIIDHGLGLYSMYGHMSRIQTGVNQMVSKADVIGFTGSTGFAAGDHLHFSMLICHTFVNPIEWWDPNWIKHNVTDKLVSIRKLIRS